MYGDTPESGETTDHKVRGLDARSRLGRESLTDLQLSVVGGGDYAVRAQNLQVVLSNFAIQPLPGQQVRRTFLQS